LATLSVRRANLVLGEAELPDFPIRADSETPAETLRFKSFISQNFPRKKFADFRRELDKAARSKATTAVRFYRSMVENRGILRSAVKIMDWFAGLQNRCPSLRLCAGCGRIFAPSRKDKMTCTETCHSRIKQANWRANSDKYKKNRIQKENEMEKQRKAG
jgi:hypothetical protein